MGENATIGPFEVTGLLGTGGMSAVLEAEHAMDATPVAIKVMTGKFARHERYRRAVYREIRATSKLNHPGIVQVLDFGEIDRDVALDSQGTLRAGSPWYAMERVDGESLSEATIAWNWWLFRDLLLDLLDGLAHAHAADVVHRDLKPSNVLVQSGAYGDSRVKLIDFGIARSFDLRRDQPGDELAEAEVYGTPKYMAPEQILGHWRDQGPWTDLYSVGCLTWRLACQTPPFEAQETQRILRAHIHAHLPPFEPSIPVPDGFEQWVARLLAKDPRERFRRAADAAFALLDLGDPDEAADPPAEREAEPTSPTGTSRLTLGVFEGTDGSGLNEPIESAPSIPGMAPVEVDEEVAGQTVGRPVSIAGHAWAPPFPEKWHRQGELEGGWSLGGAGLGLLGLRTVPVIDRRAIRDRLWERLGSVCQGGGTQGVVLRGPAGFGKSRLAEWVKRRSHEVGATEVLVATHSRTGGESEGLGAMFARHFRCADMSAGEALERVRGIYKSLSFSESTARYDAQGLVAMMMRASGEGADGLELPGFRTPRERHLALGRLLEHLSAPRPLVLWLDEVQWGKESLEFAHHLLERSEPLPVFVVATACRETLAENREVEQLLDDFEAQRDVDSVYVGQFDESDQRDLIDALLPLHPKLSAETARRTRGDPLFAVQLVEDWVDEELLQAGPDGYVLRRGAEAPFPDDIHELWERRIGRVIDDLTDDADPDEPERFRDQILASLELAAVLGQAFTWEEWRRACRRAELSVHDELLDELLRRGLATEAGEQVTFEHGTMRRSLLSSARRQGRYREFQWLAAELVDELYSSADVDVARRRAGHLQAAGRKRLAIEPLLQAAKRALQESWLRRARRILGEAERLIEELSLADEDELRVRAAWMRGYVYRQSGEPEVATRYAERAIEVARREDLRYDLAQALLVRGGIDRDAGRYREAISNYTEAIRHFEAVDDDRGRAVTTYLVGAALARQCKWDRALEALEQSLEHFEALPDLHWQATARTGISAVLIAKGRYEEAEENSRRALDIARRAGTRMAEASCWNDLGEVARFREDWERARECYRRAEELNDMGGSRAHYTNQINLALVDVEVGDYASARPVFDRLVDLYAEIGLGKHIPILHLGQMCAAAGLEAWSAWEAARRDYLQFVEDREFDAGEAGYLLEKAAELAGEVGEAERARQALQMAQDLYERLNFPERAAEVEQRLMLHDTTHQPP